LDSKTKHDLRNSTISAETWLGKSTPTPNRIPSGWRVYAHKNLFRYVFPPRFIVLQWFFIHITSFPFTSNRVSETPDSRGVTRLGCLVTHVFNMIEKNAINRLSRIGRKRGVSKLLFAGRWKSMCRDLDAHCIYWRTLLLLLL